MYATRPSLPFSATSRNFREIRPPATGALPASVAAFEMAGSDIPRQGLHIFIAAPGDVQYHNFVSLHFRSALDELCDCMRRFKRGNNSFEPRERLRGVNRFLIAHGRVFRAPLVRQPCMLWSDCRIIKAS